MPAHDLARLGDRFGPYQIEKLIGSGGFSTVYLVTHVHLQKRVAVKFLNAELCQNKEVRAQFLAEGEAASRIRHRHVVDITDVGVHAGVPYLVMEYLEGEDLQALLDREIVLDERRAAEIMLPVVAAVHQAHNAGVIHRDLKPGNVFLATTASGSQPKVLDFGISEIAGRPEMGLPSGTRKTELRFGTPAYLSPERVRDGVGDERSDQYALGVMLYEMTTGTLPFDHDTVEELLAAIKKGDFLPPRSHRPDLDPAIETLILRAMAKNPADRFESVQGLGLSLLPFARRRLRAYWESEFGIHRESDEMPPAQNLSELRPSERPPLHLLPSSPTPSLSDAEIRAALHHSGRIPTGAYSSTTVSVPVDSAPQERRGKALWIGLVVLLLAGAAAAMVFLRQPEAVAPETYSVSVDIQPASATVELDGQPRGSGALRETFELDGRAHSLLVEAPGHVPQRVTFVDQAPPPAITLEPMASSAQPDIESLVEAALAERAGMSEAPVETAETPVSMGASSRMWMQPTPRPETAQAPARPVAPAAPPPSPTAPVVARPQTTANGAPILD